MYRILIVDDEYLVRRSLIQRIQSISSDYELLEAGDSENAIRICAQWQPHIVIADIHMPMMDGLTMIERMKAANSAVQFLVLSGYAEFPLAQKALHLGVVDYLVKPVDNATLASALDKCIGLISASQSRTELTLKHERLENNLQSLNRRLDFMCLLDLPENAPAAESEQLHRRLFQRESPLYVLALLRASFHSDSDFSRDWLMQMITGELPRTGSIPHLFPHLTRDKCLYCVFTLNAPGELAGAHRYLEALTDAVSKRGIQLTAGMSLPLPRICITAKTQAQDALRQRLLFSNGQIYLFTNDYNPLQHAELQSELERLQKALEHSDAAAIRSSILKIFTPPRNVAMHYITRAYFGVMCILFSLFTVNDPSLRISPDTLDTFWDKDEFIRYLINLADSTMHRCSAENAGAISRVHLAIEYINSHYSEDISLGSICAQYAISVSYFSDLLKKELGCSLVNYITKLRIDNSCHLLQNSGLSVTDIACRVGYQDVRYFFRVFKKHQGMTPMQYRKQFTDEEGD